MVNGFPPTSRVAPVIGAIGAGDSAIEPYAYLGVEHGTIGSEPNEQGNNQENGEQQNQSDQGEEEIQAVVEQLAGPAGCRFPLGSPEPLDRGQGPRRARPFNQRLHPTNHADRPWGTWWTCRPSRGLGSTIYAHPSGGADPLPEGLQGIVWQ